MNQQRAQRGHEIRENYQGKKRTFEIHCTIQIEKKSVKKKRKIPGITGKFFYVYMCVCDYMRRLFVLLSTDNNEPSRPSSSSS